MSISVAMEFKGRIVVYSIVGCPHCKAAKTKLADLKLPYVEVNLDEYPDFRKPMMELSQRRTVPQIFFNAKHIGGNDDFHNLSEDELEKLVDDVKNNPPGKESPPIPDFDNEKDAAAGGQEDVKDENAELVDAFGLSGVIKDHRHLLTMHRKSFQGLDLVKWLKENKGMDDETALQTGKKLLEYHFLSSVRGEETFKDDSTLYRLLRDEPSNALNATVDLDVKPANASDLSIQIRKKILQLYGDYLSTDGKCVDYEGIKKSDLFKEYIQLTGQLQRVSLDALSKNEKLAFFINIYNALVIHGNVECGFPSNTWQRYKFFNNVCYRIGGLDYSLQDIENGILRANRKGVGMLTRPFSKSDPRLKVALDQHEPRIHFALVCGAKSCPPIKTYTAENVDEQLQCAAESFLEGDDGCVLDSKKKIIKLTKILDWYKTDFGNTNDKVVEWVCSTLPKCQKRDVLTNMIKEKNFKVAFMTYDWGSNKK